MSDMSCPSKITLILVDKEEDTLAKFFFNWETYELEDVRIFLTKEGNEVIHELIELNLIEIVMKTYKKIIDDYPWDFCRNLFHVITEWSLGQTPRWGNKEK